MPDHAVVDAEDVAGPVQHRLQCALLGPRHGLIAPGEEDGSGAGLLDDAGQRLLRPACTYHQACAMLPKRRVEAGKAVMQPPTACAARVELVRDIDRQDRPS